MSIENRPNDQYVARMPNPPRVDMLRSYEPMMESPMPHPTASSPRFLQGVDLRLCIHTSDKLGVEWTYRYRYSAQPILPFLYLGPRLMVKDQDFLQRAGITMVLAIRNANPTDARPYPLSLNVPLSLGIETKVIDVTNNQALVSSFPNAIHLINDHLELRNVDRLPERGEEVQGAVLLCCDTGNDRSAAVAIAYMMEICGLNLRQAHGAVQDSRFCIAVHEPLRQILRSYEMILEARADVCQANNTPGQTLLLSLRNPSNPSENANASPGSKRARDEEMTDEPLELTGEDEARFEGREFAPFAN